MSEAMIVGSSSASLAGGGGGPIAEPGRPPGVEIVVPWQLPDGPGDPAHGAAQALDPPCEMVVEWQMGGAVFVRVH